MAKADIKGTIVSDDDKWIYDWFGIQATCPADIHQAIADAAGEELEVEINSGGGDVLAGNEIYTALRMYKGNVTCIISGMAASAASYIAAARKCMITPVGLYMIHNASGGARGDYHAMDKESEVLQTVNRAITAAYMEKTSMAQEELLGLMDRETWLTAEQAVGYGFVDSILESREEAGEAGMAPAFGGGRSPVAVYNSTQILPRETIEKARVMLKGTSAQAENTTPGCGAPTRPDSVLINDKSEEERKVAEQQEQITNVQELAARYPDLVQQLRQTAAQEATVAENGRLKEIDEISSQISGQMVQDAKYGEQRMTAQDLALAAFKRNGILAGKALEDMKDDIRESGSGNVGTDANAGFADGSDGLDGKAKVMGLSEKLKESRGKRNG